MMFDTKTQNAKPPARLHAILARRGPNAVVFRRGPSDKVAVIGWDRSNDTFALGQWLRGRIYPLRCDLSPKGEHLIYFAAKYGRVNPVEKIVREEMERRVGNFYNWYDEWQRNQTSDFESFIEAKHREAEHEEKLIRDEHRQEFQRMEQSADYHDYSWTAISRTPYLKALSLWWHGTGWNGGGIFESEREFYLNRPPEWIAKTIPGVQDRRFKELPLTDYLKKEQGWGTQGECMMVYDFRLERDGWHYLEDAKPGWFYEKTLPNGWILRKEFPGGFENWHEIYWERHLLLDADCDVLMNGDDWRWAEFDAYRKRIVYAENGALYALSLKLPLKPILLQDFNDMTFRRIAAPY